MSKRNVLLGVLVALAAVTVGGCSKESETRLCNPGTVLVHFVCSEALGKVSATAALEGLTGQMTTKDINVTCPGSYNLEVNVTGYEKGGKIKAVVSANAGEMILTKDKLIEIPLDEGCTKFDLALGTPDALNKTDAAVVMNTDDGGTKPVNGVDGGVVPDADMTSLGVARGGSCARDEQCTDGHCADGVCCDKACDGVCMACTIEKTGSQTGQCSLTKSGVKHGKCDAKVAGSCGTNGMCDGAGKCSFWDSTNECVAAACNGGDFVPAQKCSGAGACQAASPSKCGEYACSPQGCKTSCTVAGDCSAGVQCIGGKCGGKRALGEACGANSECTSPGFCVDDVCCGGACEGKCEACSGVLTGGKNGECLPVPASKGNQGDCTVQSAVSCGTTGRCDGARKCEYHAAGTECAGQMCSGAGYAPARKCDGGGTCLAVNVTACGAYVCVSGNCKNPCAADGDCVAGNFCSNGNCIVKKDLGVQCSAMQECSSNSCVDAICCDKPCSDPSETCSPNGVCRNRYSKQTYIKASNASSIPYGSAFGTSISSSGETFAVGDPEEKSSSSTVNGTQTQSGTTGYGAAYVFARSGPASGWSQQAYIKGSIALDSGRFGNSVALEGDVLAVGQPGGNRVFVFQRTGGSWAEVAALSPTFNGKEAGASLALSGDYLVAGDVVAGKVHVFRRTFGVWRYDQTVKPPDSDSSIQYTDVGRSVSLQGSRLVVGAPTSSFLKGSETRTSAGLVLVYERDQSNVWQLKAEIKQPDTGIYQRYGWSAQLNGIELAVGAIDSGNPLARGAVHVLNLSNNTWTQTKKILPPSGRLFESLGSGVFADSRFLIATARGSGLIYMYKRQQGDFVDIGQLGATGSRSGEGFSSAIAGSSTFIVVGAVDDKSSGKGINPSHDPVGQYVSGAVYVLE